MHDMVGYYVSGIVVQAQAARHVANRQPAAAAVAIAPYRRGGRLERFGIAEPSSGPRSRVRDRRALALRSQWRPAVLGTSATTSTRVVSKLNQPLMGMLSGSGSS